MYKLDITGWIPKHLSAERGHFYLVKGELCLPLLWIFHPSCSPHPHDTSSALLRGKAMDSLEEDPLVIIP